MKKTVFLFTLYFFVNHLLIAQITQIGSPINGFSNSLQAGASISFNNDGTIVSVGYLYTSPFFEDHGMARVFELLDGEWIQKGNDLGNQLTDDRGFHVSLNGSGNILAMSTGSVYGAGSIVTIYEFINSNWQLMGSPINISDGYAQISELGDTIIISNILHEPIVYEYINDNWQQKGNLISDGFGLFSLDINSLGDIIAISNLLEGTYTVRIFKYEGNQWNPIGDIDATAYSLLSLSVHLSSIGETCLITTLQEDDNEILYLKSIVYNYENENWSQVGNTIITNPTEEFIHIENISAINATGNIIAIGNPIDNGNVMLYKLINNQWSQLGEGISGHGGEFGRAISFNEDATMISVGAPIFSDVGFYFGQVTSYEIDYNQFSIEDNLFSEGIILHPNPVKNILHLTTQNNTIIQKVSAYTISGKMVLEVSNNISPLNMSSLNKGLYFIKIETNKGNVTKKIIKQ